MLCSMKKIFVAFFVFLSIQNLSKANPLGEELLLRNNEFGATYTHADDPDGYNYVLTGTIQTNLQNQTIRWNFYSETKKDFLLPWNDSRSLGYPSFQMRLTDEEIIKAILAGQGPKKDMTAYFVLDVKSGESSRRYHLNLSKLCEQFANHFKDLTLGSACNSY